MQKRGDSIKKGRLDAGWLLDAGYWNEKKKSRSNAGLFQKI
jgi:hypothetical protein